MVQMQYFLVALAILFPSTVLTSYLIATLNNHTEADFPYISDTGTFVPESCIFGQMLNMCALLFGFVVYLRYLQVEQYAKSFGIQHLRPYSLTCLISGVSAAFGMSIVANFQETNVFVMHMIGAFIAFCMPIIYMFCDAVLSFRTTPMALPKWMCFVRISIAVLYTLSFVLSITFSYIAPIYFHGDNYQYWQPDDGGWEYHVVSAAFEWAMGILICGYAISYYREFQHCSINHPQVRLGPGLTSKQSDAAMASHHGSFAGAVIVTNQRKV